MSEIDNIADPEWRQLAFHQCEQFIIEAVKKQGAFALAQPFRDTVFHEVGHAVMYAAQGDPVQFIAIWEESKFRRHRMFEKAQKRVLKNRSTHISPAILKILQMHNTSKLPAWCGRCRSGLRGADLGPDSTDEQVHHRLRQTIAGFISETLINIEPGSQPAASSIDERMAAQIFLASRWGENGKRAWDDIYFETTTCLQLNGEVIGELSDALKAAPAKGHVQHHLEGEILQTILAKVRPFTETFAAGSGARRIANDNADRAGRQKWVDDGSYESTVGWNADVQEHEAA